MDFKTMEQIYKERYSTRLEARRKLYAKDLINWLISKGHLPSNKNKSKILDLGCGTGLISWNLSVQGYDFIAFDRINVLSDEIPQENFMKGDIEKKLKIKDNVFTHIFARDVIEHIKNRDNFFKETFRILKKKGKIVIITPATEKLTVGEFYSGYEHITPYTKVSLEEGLRLFGFKNIQVNYFASVPIFKANTDYKFYFPKFRRKVYLLGVAEK